MRACRTRIAAAAGKLALTALILSVARAGPKSTSSSSLIAVKSQQTPSQRDYQSPDLRPVVRIEGGTATLGEDVLVAAPGELVLNLILGG
ncbi:MAG: hypothetical protein M0C28_05270 [Candidatus Moduliflexus flocculans]|nr:hypothetical protein [Candidatus Moduliflexus flocculans]